MKEFDKTDIKVLDYMVNTVIEKGFVNGDDVIKEGFIKLKDTSGFEFNVRAKEIATDEFVRYLHILDKYGVCECFFSEDAEFGRKDERTFQFQKQGGFQTLYTSIEEKRKREKLELRKAEVDLDLAEKVLKEYPKTKWIARIGFFIGIGLAILELTKWLMNEG